MSSSSSRVGGVRVGRVSPSAKRRKVGRSAAKPLPSKVDLRPYLTPVEEQVGMSCVANTCAGAYEYLAKRHLGKDSDVSRLFIYFNARAESGDEHVDDGTSLQDAIAGLKKYGACNEELWPNDEDYINEEPSEAAYEHAAQFTIAEAEYVETDLNLWKHTLADGYPIAFCLNTFTSFDKATTNKGRVPMPKIREQEREEHGWHAMLCVGYLEKDQLFIVRNSWGSEWGDEGYCYIPYKYLLHDELNGQDSWMVRSVAELDFDHDLESYTDESYFAEEGSVQLFDFYVATEDVEGFATALEALCLEYADEEDFYFDYDETEEDDITYAEVTNFDITIEDSAEFLTALDELCAEWAEDENYSYTVEGAEASEDDEADESDNEDNNEDETMETITFSEFYIYTDSPAKALTQVEKLCLKYAGDSYNFESIEDEDDTGRYLQLDNLEVIGVDAQAFLADLEALCEDLCNDNGYNFETE